jgi:hypothetical protein
MPAIPVRNAAMTDGLKRIEKEILAFSDEVAQCQDTDDMAVIQDAYHRLNVAWSRYGVEKETLRRPARNAFGKVFERDKFMEGMGEVRGISEHILPKDGTVLTYPDGSNFRITSASSAAAMFANPRPVLIDADGKERRWDHPRHLAEAERRMTRALGRAKTSED